MSIEQLIKDKCPNWVEWKELEDVAIFERGKWLKKDDKSDWETSIILYWELYTTYWNYITEIVSKTEFDKAKNSTLANETDILLPISSTSKEAKIGKASVLMVNNVYIWWDAVVLHHKQNPWYLMYILNSNRFEKEKMKNVRWTTIMHLSPDWLSKIKIPIPPMEVQNEIVKTLDEYTELEARKKQYEYYRDKLLTFN